MSLFVVDTAGDQDLYKEDSVKGPLVTRNLKKTVLEEKISSKSSKVVECDADYEDYFGLPPPSVDLNALIDDTLTKTVTEKGKVDRALEDVKEKVDAVLENVRNKSRTRGRRGRRVYNIDHSDFNVMTGKFDDEQLLMINTAQQLSGSNIPPGLEQLKALPRPTQSQLAKQKKIERAKTKGHEWYNLPATEMTDEVKNELKILQMRSVIDPKHFYKKNDFKVLPKYFQIGTVLPSPLDYYNERDTRKNKKRSLVDELLADTEFQTYNKRKYNEAMARKNKYAQRKVTKKMKKLKKQK